MADSAPRPGKSERSSSRTSWATDPWASQPAPDRPPVSVRASGAAASTTTSQTTMTVRRRRTDSRASRSNRGGRPFRPVEGEDAAPRMTFSVSDMADILVPLGVSVNYPPGYP